MNARLRTLVVLIGLALGLSFPAPAGAAPGDPAPAFDLVDLDGKRHTYAEYDGRVLILFFVGHN